LAQFACQLAAIQLHTLHEQLFIQIRSSARHYLSWSYYLKLIRHLKDSTTLLLQSSLCNVTGERTCHNAWAWLWQR